MPTPNMGPFRVAAELQDAFEKKTAADGTTRTAMIEQWISDYTGVPRPHRPTGRPKKKQEVS